ncbi:MAG TPA: alpha/beta hydrolase [Lamprocystis sp. (in: g-proteobacteria)]|nr:alpha/beta hydrolase [Lamprocystis sp. (in: g-proteobacteria)]
MLALLLLGLRAYSALNGPPLEPWHTFVPQELTVTEMDSADWGQYLKAEEAIFASMRTEVSQRLSPEDRVPYNRYFEESPVYPARLAEDWNRSYVLQPTGKPLGAVVMLHGLTDSPYSLRHIARLYRERGFFVVGIRLPAHGTVPAALTAVEWEDWMAATRLAVREARRQLDPAAPLHLVGYSNGGALAAKYALDAIEDPRLARPDRLILISPMIGITRFARMAGLAALPAILPAFEKAAWLGVLPEFNPFKYNSFPVNGARQSYRLTDALQRQTRRLANAGLLGGLAPVLTFQSVLDFTVSTPAIISGLFAHLPENGSELVLFDVNRSLKFGPLMRPATEAAVERLLPPLPQRYRITIIANAASGAADTVARSFASGETTAQVRPLGIPYPLQIFSLSHVALPFPLDDSLYGTEPSPDEFFGVNLGNIAARGERGALVINLDSLFRIASNPFFPYMLEQIEEGIADPSPAVTVTATGVVPAAVAPASAATPPDDYPELFSQGAATP